MSLGIFTNGGCWAGQLDVGFRHRCLHVCLHASWMGLKGLKELWCVGSTV